MKKDVGCGRLFGMIALGLLALPALAQTASVTAADYARAERLVGYNANPLVDHAVTTVTWLDDGHAWYRDHDEKGDRFLQVDAATGAVSPAVDAARLAAALAKSSAKPVDPTKLPLTRYRVRDDGGRDVTVAGKHYRCDRQFAACTLITTAGGH